MNTLAEQQVFFQKTAGRFAHHYLGYAETHATDPSKVLEELPNLKISFKYLSNCSGSPSESDDRNLIRLIHAMKPTLNQSGYWGELIPLLEEGQRACERANDTVERLNFINTLAQMHTNQEDYEATIHWSQKAIELAEQTDNLEALAEAHLRLGWVYMYIAEYDKALRNLQHSEKLSRQIGQWELLGSALHFLGRINAERGDFELALRCFREELQLPSKAKSSGAWAFVWLRGAHYLLEMGRVKVAKRLALRSMHIFQTVENIGGVAHALRELARVELVEGNVEDSLGHLTESLRLIGYRRGEVNVKQDIANVYLTGGWIDEANQMLDSVIQHRQTSGERKELAEALYLKGQVYEALGKLEQAIELYQQSLNLFETIGCLPSITNRPRSAILRLKSVSSDQNWNDFPLSA